MKHTEFLELSKQKFPIFSIEKEGMLFKDDEWSMHYGKVSPTLYEISIKYRPLKKKPFCVYVYSKDGQTWEYAKPFRAWYL
jgi:hypothetical protein